MTRPTGRFTLVLTIQFLLSTTVPAISNASQTDALLAWKSSLRNPEVLSTWSRATPTCSWRGVACNTAGNVTVLRLQDLGLSGSLDALHFAALPSLTTLDLNGNNLAGAIPSNISTLRTLASLDLGNNRFIGHIPPQLGGLANLTELDLSVNSLIGPIPSSFGNLKQLTQLALFFNELTAKIPTSRHCESWTPSTITLLRNLQYLSVFDNNMSGTVPPDLGAGL